MTYWGLTSLVRTGTPHSSGRRNPLYDIYDIRVDFNGAHYDYEEGYDLSTISKIWVTCPMDGVVVLNWR